MLKFLINCNGNEKKQFLYNEGNIDSSLCISLSLHLLSEFLERAAAEFTIEELEFYKLHHNSDNGIFS